MTSGFVPVQMVLAKRKQTFCARLWVKGMFGIFVIFNVIIVFILFPNRSLQTQPFYFISLEALMNSFPNTDLVLFEFHVPLVQSCIVYWLAFAVEGHIT